MLEIPEVVKGLFQTDGIRKNLRIHFPNAEVEDLTNDNIVLKSFRFTESMCSRTELQLGLCEASSVQFEAVGVPNIKGCKIQASCEIDCSSLGEEWCEENATTSDDVPFPYYSIPYGVFYVDKCPKKSGATKNHRSITAYTKEAYTKWEFPESINLMFNRGWYESKTFAIPVSVVRKTMFPELCEGTPTTVTSKSTMSSGVAFKYKDSNGVNKQFIVYPYKLKSSYQFINDMYMNRPNQIRVYQGKSADIENIGIIKRGIDEIEKKIIESGGSAITDKDSCITALVNKLPSYYSYKYDTTPSFDRKTQAFSSNTETETYYYPTDRVTMKNSNSVDEDFNIAVPYINQIKIISGTLDAGGNYDVYYSPNVLQSEISILAGINIKSLPTAYVPDYLSQYASGSQSASQRIYDFGNVLLKTFSDTNLDGINLYITNDKSETKTFNKRIIKKNADTGEVISDTTTTYTGTLYSPSESIDINLLDMLKSEAELQGMMGKFNRYGKFEYISISGGIGLYPSEDLYPSESLYPQEPSIVLHNGAYSNAEWEDEYSKPFDKVEVEYKDTDGNTVYTYLALVDLEDEGYFEENYQSYSITDNYFIKNQTFTAEEIQAILEEVASNISGIKYMPAEVDMRGLPYVEAGDYIEFLTDDRGFQTLVLRNTIQGEQYLTQTIESN